MLRLARGVQAPGTNVRSDCPQCAILHKRQDTTATVIPCLCSFTVPSSPFSEPLINKKRTRTLFRKESGSYNLGRYSYGPRNRGETAAVTCCRPVRVAFADFSAAPWRGLEKSERGPSLASLFPPQAAVGSAAVRVPDSLSTNTSPRIT